MLSRNCDTLLSAPSSSSCSSNYQQSACFNASKYSNVHEVQQQFAQSGVFLDQQQQQYCSSTNIAPLPYMLARQEYHPAVSIPPSNNMHLLYDMGAIYSNLQPVVPGAMPRSINDAYALPGHEASNLGANEAYAVPTHEVSNLGINDTYALPSHEVSNLVPIAAHPPRTEELYRLYNNQSNCDIPSNSVQEVLALVPNNVPKYAHVVVPTDDNKYLHHLLLPNEQNIYFQPAAAQNVLIPNGRNIFNGFGGSGVPMLVGDTRIDNVVRFSDGGIRISDGGVRISDTGFRINDAGVRINDSGVRISEGLVARNTVCSTAEGSGCAQNFCAANGTLLSNLACGIFDSEPSN